jgi:hypothetical protein
MTSDEADAAIEESLAWAIELGLMVEIQIDGEPHLQLTERGEELFSEDLTLAQFRAAAMEMLPPDERV